MKKILIALFLSAAATLTVFAAARYIDNNDGTIKDNATGLIWTKCSIGSDGTVDTDVNCTNAGKRTWEQALADCETLANYGNRSNWRLPNINELRSIADRKKSSPAIDTIYFPGTGSWDYWSSSTLVAYPEIAWIIDFGVGFTRRDHSVKTSSCYVRCVSGP